MSRGEELLCQKPRDEEMFFSSITSIPEEELLAALRRSEEDVLLAAQVGNALLEHNRRLKEERDALELLMEELQQERHELRVKLEETRVQKQEQVEELQRDVMELQERMSGTLSQRKSQSQLTNHKIHALQHQLNSAAEVERTMSLELQRLREELRERGRVRPQDEEVLSALREQVARLRRNEETLERREEESRQEQAELRERVAALNARLELREEQSLAQTQQLAEAWREAELVGWRAQELQSQLDQRQDHEALQETGGEDVSLLTELENSLMGHAWSPETPESVCDMSRSIVGVSGDPCENAAQILELQDQKRRLESELQELREQMKMTRDSAHQAVKERDHALAKKTAVEAELVSSRRDVACLDQQLMEAVRRKLELAQELEAWQDDVQMIINQQLKNQQQCDQHQHHQRRRHLDRLPFLRPTPWRDWIRRGK